MKLVFFSYSDTKGGAAKAAFSIYRSLNRSFFKCYFFCIDKSHKESLKLCNNLHFIYINFLRSLEKFIIFFFKSKFHQSLNIFNSYTLFKINNIEFDIIYLHWINRSCISLKEILKIKKKVLISLHDMWFLNGTSHYFYRNTKTNNSLEKYILNQKKIIYHKKNIFFIAHSKWMYSEALKLIPKKKVFLCKYYPIDSNLFKPRSKQNLKSFFNIKTDKKIVLFIAQNISDKRKGQINFYHVVKYFHKYDKFYFVIVGGGNLDKKMKVFNNILHIPHLNHEQLAQVYSLSDIYISTSVIDNLPLTILEAMSSGLVVISTNSGGAKEVIRNCGYLVSEKNYKGIIDILKKITNKSIAKKSIIARHFALENFSYAKNIINYRKIINQIHKT